MVNGVHIAEELISARRVSKSFGRRVVLRDASVSVRPGEIVGIVGENGAGKTTLLKILLGLLAADSGEIDVDGRVGYCPQELTLFDRLTVAEHFTYFAAAYGLSRRRAWTETMESLLERFRFERYRTTLVANLSGGTKQKLNLSLALLHAPDMLVLDEPYAGLDWETYVHFWNLAHELRDGGKSLLVVSHFVYEQAKYDRILELSDGRL